jgi:hypothetical protein
LCEIIREKKLGKKEMIEALNGGFHSAFIVGAIVSVIATAIVVIGLKKKMRTEKTIAKV